MANRLFPLLTLGFLACASTSPSATPVPTAGLTAQDGLFTTFADAKTGRLLARLPTPDVNGVSLRVVYLASLGAGMGSNPVGLDRGITTEPVVLAFRIVAGQVLAVAENHAFIADSDDPNERRAVRESFAESVLWAGAAAAIDGDGVLVDLSSFVARDALGIAAHLKERSQGSFSLDAGRSLLDAAATLVFPNNVEAEAILTFSSVAPGDEVRSTTPVPQALTLRVHHSFIRLPDDGYTPRLADPRMPAVPFPVRDYAAGLDEPIERRLALRFRLEKDDDGVRAPIVFYVDRGAPEPVRSALVEGASWWEEAFEAAGFPGGYRVEVLPEGASPLDVRYNVIQWAHRETRGWSYGNPIADPRTGEIIVGRVTLGSLRLRQDRMIFEGLLGADKTGSGAPDDPIELALARVRQLAAHEVGHCLGFLHNMAASTNDRASVMDYPAPWIRPGDDGTLDTSQAYAVGIGPWDEIAVEYSYREIPSGEDEASFLDAIARKASEAGLNFVTDPHSRPVSAAHPAGNVWDNGSDPIAMLDETMEVRRIALATFGPNNVRPGRSLSDLHDVLVPVYLYHRYQLNAAAKLVGGARWTYGLRGEARAVESVSSEQQRSALSALLRTVSPSALELPPALLDALIPEPVGWYDGPRRERFATETAPLFDPVQAARTAADLTFGALLHPARLSRVAEQKRRNPSQLGVAELLERARSTAFANDSARRDLRDAIAERYISHVMAAATELTSPVSDRLAEHLAALRRDAARNGLVDLEARITRFLERPAPAAAPSVEPARVPPGGPIGAGADEMGWHVD